MSIHERKLVIILFLLAILTSLNFFGLEKENKTALAKEKIIEIKQNIYRKHFTNLSLEARSAFVYDALEQKAIFALAENKTMPLASIAKVMTAIVALENIPDNAVLEISHSALVEEGDNGLLVGEKWGRDELLKFMLFVSSNDAAKAVQEYVGLDFINLMNEKAAALGLSNTSFSTVSGLDLMNRAGALGSAKDVAMLFSHALDIYPEIFSLTAYNEQTFESLSGFKHIVKNTNKSANFFPQMIASKTGLTALAGGNLVIAFDYGISHPIIVVVLGSGEEGRFRDTLALSKASLNYLSDLAQIEQ